MSYTPTDWKTGDVITADKLNNMESGIVNAGSGGGGGGDVVTFNFLIEEDHMEGSMQIYKILEVDGTPENLMEAMDAGKICAIKCQEQYYDDDDGATYLTGWKLWFFDSISSNRSQISGVVKWYDNTMMHIQASYSLGEAGTWFVKSYTPSNPT